MPRIFHNVTKKHNFKKWHLDCYMSSIESISMIYDDIYYQSYLHSDCDPPSFLVSQELGMENDLLAVFVRQRVIQIIWEMYLARIFNMLSRYADRETSIALRLVRLICVLLAFLVSFWSRILEQKRTYYLFEQSYASNFRNIIISNIIRILIILLSILFTQLSN